MAFRNGHKQRKENSKAELRKSPSESPLESSLGFYVKGRQTPEAEAGEDPDHELIMNTERIYRDLVLVKVTVTLKLSQTGPRARPGNSGKGSF